MKEAIEILDTYIKISRDENPQFISGMRWARSLIAGHYEKQKHTWEPSPDTPYKIELTKWIEKKKWFEAYERIKDTDVIHKGNPYSLFESWQKAQDEALITGRGAVSVSLNSNNELEVKHVDILDHEEGEG